MNIIDILYSRSKEKYPLIQVLLGPRQVGKTTDANKLFESWSGSKIMISADSPSNQSPDFIEANWFRARSMPEPCLLIIDEVQKIDNWSDKIKELYDQDRGNKDLRIFLLGSASLSVQSGLSESLAGRFEIIHANHWQYEQMKKIFSWDIETYLKYGGYPGAVRLIDDVTRWQKYILDSIVEPVLSRDLGLITNIAKPALFRQLFALTMEYPAQEVSYQKLTGQLQEKGTPQTIKHYLNILEGGFLLKQVLQYSKRALSTRTSSPKIIPLAPALINAFNNPKRLDVEPAWRGRVFEAMVGSLLNSRGYEMYYWRDGNREVDYIIKHEKKITAVEIKSSRPRKISGLNYFLKLYPEADSLVITPENFSSVI